MVELVRLCQQSLPCRSLKTVGQFALVEAVKLILKAHAIDGVQCWIIVILSTRIALLTLLRRSKIIILHHFNS
jgi:hypothetical protein